MLRAFWVIPVCVQQSNSSPAAAMPVASSMALRWISGLPEACVVPEAWCRGVEMPRGEGTAAGWLSVAPYATARTLCGSSYTSIER